MEGRKEVHDSSFLYHSKWEIMYFGKNVFGLTSLVFQDFQCNRNKRQYRNAIGCECHVCIDLNHQFSKGLESWDLGIKLKTFLKALI